MLCKSLWAFHIEYHNHVSDAYGNLLDDSQWQQHDKPDSDGSDDEPRKNDRVKIEKFRDLIRSLQDDKPARQNNEEFEMEVTWEPGMHYFVCYCVTAVGSNVRESRTLCRLQDVANWQLVYAATQNFTQ